MELELINNQFFDSVKKLESNADIYFEEFNSSKIRLLKIDNFLPLKIATHLEKNFPNISSESNLYSKRYQIGKHIVSKDKNNTHLLNESLLKILNNFKSVQFLNFLKKLSGIDDLYADHEDWGGGVHQTERGGFLKRHVDAPNKGTDKYSFRRLNVIFYLNSNWKKAYKGDLEIWDSKHSKKSLFKIMPIINRLVFFETSSQSWHGHPQELNCPNDMTRKSIALFYYSKNPGHQNKKQEEPLWCDDFK